MSYIMSGVGLAHMLAEALDNSKANFGTRLGWTDAYVNKLTTKDGKKRVLGPMLDVLRGDAEIVPKKRVIVQDFVKPGDKDMDGDDEGVVVFNRLPANGQQHLVVGEFALGIASRIRTRIYEDRQSEIEEGKFTVPKTHVGVPDDREFLELDEELLLPKHLRGRNLPGIAVRNFFVENPHHIPECFSRITLFWGTICKNDWCYYVPGIDVNGSPYGRRICTYETIDGEDVLDDFEHDDNDAAVFIK